VNFGPRVRKVKNFGNAHLVDRFRDWAEILQDRRKAPAAGAGPQPRLVNFGSQVSPKAKK